MAKVNRPTVLQINPKARASLTLSLCSAPSGTSFERRDAKPLSPTGDSLPSQILPHLFVGSQDQTNRDTLNRLNISYILSLGLLPLISTTPSSQPITASPKSPSSTVVSLPSRNSSLDFRVRIRATNTPLTPAPSDSVLHLSPKQTTTSSNPRKSYRAALKGDLMMSQNQAQSQSQQQTENKGVKQVRSIQCKCINIADDPDQSLSKFLDEAFRFIDEARKKRCNILVHCLAGISRSPAIAIAYLMHVNSLRLQDAYNLVKQCRPQIGPNLGFMGELVLYEKSLNEKRTIEQIIK